MAGFFGLFNGNNGASEYFLEPDAAKTLGDIDYMRTSKSVRKSFPKEKVGEDNESLTIASATEQRIYTDGKTVVVSSDKAAPGAVQQSIAQPNPESAERRRTDMGMDLFRSMAKDLRK